MSNDKFANDLILNRSDSQTAVIQELIIHPDGSVEIPWITPAASNLILAVWQEINHEPFPVKTISGQLYCG
jgi:hypothetical protein